MASPLTEQSGSWGLAMGKRRGLSSLTLLLKSHHLLEFFQNLTACLILPPHLSFAEKIDKDEIETSALQADIFYRINLSPDSRFSMVPGASILLPDRNDLPRTVAYTLKVQCSL